MSILPTSDYYAVIFSSTKSTNLEGYEEMDKETMLLAQQQTGFLGYESVNFNNKGIFISYWQSKNDIDMWRKNATHLMAKAQAKHWYKRYLSQICLVQSSHEFNSEN